MHGVQPRMLEMVAVGAMARQFELRIPCSRMRTRSSSQSSCERGTIDEDGHAALLSSRSSVSSGSRPRSHLEPAIAGVGAALRGEIAAGAVGVEGDGFERLVVESDRLGRVERDALLVERVLHPHDAETDGTMPAIGDGSGFDRVEIDVDDVIEHPHDHGDGFAQARRDRASHQGAGAPRC